MHHGTYDDASDNDLSIFAVDGLLQRGPFEILGEAAWVSIEGGDPNAAGGAPPARMDGYYVQGNYHFMPEFLKKSAPTFFTDASIFTAVVRWGEADTNSDSSSNVNDINRLTLGINFRPVEDSVVKFAYTFNDHEDGEQSRNGWQFNMSTYF